MPRLRGENCCRPGMQRCDAVARLLSSNLLIGRHLMGCKHLLNSLTIPSGSFNLDLASWLPALTLHLCQLLQ